MCLLVPVLYVVHIGVQITAILELGTSTFFLSQVSALEQGLIN